MPKFRFTIFLALISIIPVHAEAQDPFRPEGHIKIERPANLDGAGAESIYAEISRQMAEGYAQSDEPAAKNYQELLKFNSAPYLSAGHGNRFLNNYGNRVSENYLRLEEGEAMPVGSVLLKDSFTVTDDDEIFAGALFIMEKLAGNASPDTGDWRYVMILPDGSKIGDTTGANPEAMTFCHTCHIQAEHTDYVFGIRGKFADPEFR